MVAAPDPSLQTGLLAESWRKDKSSDFAWRARCLGSDTDPLVQQLLQRIADETAAVNAIWAQQQAADATAPWWADGEYDDAEADRHNDAGTAAQKQGSCSTAFDHFTEAIRLCPRRATYHANRAAAALRLGRADTAAEDAANAVQRDPTHVRAHVRGGQAALKLRDADVAAQYFRDALRLSPGLPAAEAGARASAWLAAQLAEEWQQSAAADGTRAPLPLRAPGPDEAAEALLAADAMLAANPGLPAARVAHVEAVILARRFAAAVDELGGIHPGAHRDYLAAEVAWRQGDLCAAISMLQAATGSGVAAGRGCGSGSGGGGHSGGGGGGDSGGAAPPSDAGSRKLMQQLQHLRPLAALLHAAKEAHEDGRHQDCFAACGRLLVDIDGRGAAGLEAAVLRLRARAAVQLRQLDVAEADVNMALAAQPGDAGTLLLQAEVLQQAGKHQEALLSLQAVMAAAPATPGLLQRLQTAAAQARRSRVCGTSSGAQGAGSAPSRGHYAVLGITAAADSSAVRSAYRQQAARWHPDKWAAADAAAQRDAAARFLAVQRAYEVLGDEQQRALYDMKFVH